MLFTRNFARLSLALLTAASVLLSAGCATMTPEERETQLRKADAHRNIGIDHVYNGRVAQGIRDLRFAVELREDDAYTHLWLGEAYRQKDRIEEALKHTQRSVELDPTNHEALMNLSVLYLHLENYEKAAKVSQQLVDDPTFVSPERAATNCGWALLKLRRFDEAKQSFSDALDFNNEFWPAILNLGILAQAEGQHKDSLRFYLEVLDRKTGPRGAAEANYRIAESYVRLGDKDRAIDHLAKAIELEPEGRWGNQSREYLQRLM